MSETEKPTIIITTISNLAKALAAAQAEFKAPLKNRVVDFTHEGKRTKYSYADLADVIEAIQGPLSKNQLAVSHRVDHVGAGFFLITSLLHSSGERIESFYPLPNPMGIKPQQFGSALTYARRYSLSCIVGIASEEDDDGQAAPKPDGPKTTPPEGSPNMSAQGLYKDGKKVDTTGGHGKAEASASVDPKKVTGPQLNRLNAIANSKKWSHDQVKQYAKAFCGVDSTKDLGRREYDILVKVIEASTFDTAMKELK